MLNWLWLIGFMLAGSGSALFAFAAQDLGEKDPAGLYLMITVATVGADLTGDAAADVQEVGPLRAPFARMITAGPSTHAALLDAGHWLLPAGRLAALCGIDTLSVERTGS
ncbi:MAG: hypothetical protein AAF744_10460 [Pseudomonadota bacterium]